MDFAMWSETVAGVAIEVAAAGDVGGREENQDNFVLILPGGGGARGWCLRDGRRVEASVSADWPETAVRLAVIDGMGGHADGRRAAEALAEALFRLPFQRSPAAMRDAVRGVHAELRERLPGPDDRRGGATLVLIDLDLAVGRGVKSHVGDSRARFVHRGRDHALTYDHRPCEFAWRDGEISAEEYRARSGPGPLAQAVGFGSTGILARGRRSVDAALRLDLPEDLGDEAVGHADVARFRIGRPGDRLVLATDGLLTDGRIPERLFHEDVSVLASVVAERGAVAGDNLTGVVFAVVSTRRQVDTAREGNPA